MIKFKIFAIIGVDYALEYVRNATDSPGDSDSYHCWDKAWCEECPMHFSDGYDERCLLPTDDSPILGPNDRALMAKLLNDDATKSCRFLNKIAVRADITAPTYWWNELGICVWSNSYLGSPLRVDASTRSVILDYGLLSAIYKSYKDYDPMFEFDEWREFCEWIGQLPYSEFIIGERK